MAAGGEVIADYDLLWGYTTAPGVVGVAGAPWWDSVDLDSGIDGTTITSDMGQTARIWSRAGFTRTTAEPFRVSRALRDVVPQAFADEWEETCARLGREGSPR